MRSKYQRAQGNEGPKVANLTLHHSLRNQKLSICRNTKHRERMQCNDCRRCYIDTGSSVAAWLGGARGPWPPPADFFGGAPKFKKGAKNLMKLHDSITFFQHHVAGHTGGPYRCI